MSLGMTSLTAQVSFGQTRFGALRPSEEKRIFKFLPPEVRVMELINQNEELSRLPMGFEVPKQRTARESQQKNVEQQLLGAVQNPRFSQKHAEALLIELYQKRDSLQQQLPEAIFNAIFSKATAPPPVKAKPEATAEEDPLPPSIRKRMGNGTSNQLILPAGDLEAIIAAAAQKGYGRG